MERDLLPYKVAALRQKLILPLCISNLAKQQNLVEVEYVYGIQHLLLVGELTL